MPGRLWTRRPGTFLVQTAYFAVVVGTVVVLNAVGLL